MVKQQDTVADERAVMKEFWMQHSHQASVEEMMLDSQAHIISKKDTPEIMSYLPSLQGKRVLELGAGIGRFTSAIAATAAHVVAVDFMETFIEENRTANAHLGNIDFVCSDALSLDFPAGSFDVVFSNWLLMYLNDDEVRTLASRILNWLAPGGYVFFRESCFHQSGNKPRDSNPSHYRDPEVYEAMFEDTVSEEGFFFELDGYHTVDVYVKLKNNPNQRCWLFRKAAGTLEQSAEFQEFLDKQQYSINGITRYERVFGAGFVSTGGIETTSEFVATLNLQPGEYVLDVGHGIGGGDFYMAREYGVRVLGIDLSCNMTHIARQRSKLPEQASLDVHFDICDVTAVNFPPESFDVIYSRDTILHIEDKHALFANFFRWLRPGGRLLISDYCCGAKEHTPAFKEYVAQRGYHLLSVPKYGKVLEDVGFDNVKAEDRTEQFVRVLERELKATREMKDEFVRDFSLEDYDALVSGWEGKLVRCAAGDQKWGLFTAHKSA